MKRISVLDLLRGSALLLVMLVHAEASKIIVKMGWISVDLFFVLSGFLVSGILFSEYKQFNKIRPLYFLGRRGFKIYPLFYFVLIIHLVYYACKGESMPIDRILPELFFYQNYQEGIMAISWTLAVEEHFYFLLSILLFIVAVKNKIINSVVVPIGCLFIGVSCFLLRSYTFLNLGYQGEFVNHFPTHLRIDSLSFGVLISYLFSFHRQRFSDFIKMNKRTLLLLGIVLLLPVFIWDKTTFIICTFGYTFVYVSLGILIALSLEFPDFLKELTNKFHFQFVYDFMVWVGRYSYGIYLIHFLVGPGASNFVRENVDADLPAFVYIAVYLTSDILFGVLLTHLIEKPFLRIREKLLPVKR